MRRLILQALAAAGTLASVTGGALAAAPAAESCATWYAISDRLSTLETHSSSLRACSEGNGSFRIESVNAGSVGKNRSVSEAEKKDLEKRVKAALEKLRDSEPESPCRQQARLRSDFLKDLRELRVCVVPAPPELRYLSEIAARFVLLPKRPSK